MKNILKWIFVAGAILSGLLLMGALIFNQSFVGQSMTSFWHGGMMINGGRHSTFGGWTSSGWVIFGGLFLLLIILFGAIHSQSQSVSEAGVQSIPMKICPACAADLEPYENNCPHCGCDLS